MGLLDDAIREHLELKRLRGADPGQVAREEHEALGPIERREGRDEGEPQLAPTPAPPTGDETTELDMSTVLGEGGPEQPAPPDPQVDAEAPVTDRAASQDTGDSLEWEMPQAHPAGPVAEGDAPGADLSEQAPPEDVLEETPDFLRETPEQERLWFEQRPPRDFDFDK